ncbi:MAG: DUF1015 domain-containing protein [Eubacteriales bacterium]
MQHFFPAKIILPNFQKVDGQQWAVIACDQFTGEPDYWAAVEALVADAPSTLRLTLPEIFLEQASTDRIRAINRAMDTYAGRLLTEHEPSYVYLERVQADGRVRRGLVGMIDLEDYSFAPDADTPVRSTEGTVAERIPPRVAIRAQARLELPHVMLLFDDPGHTVLAPFDALTVQPPSAYDFPLMLGGGHARGWFVPATEQAALNARLAALVTDEARRKKYGHCEGAPLLFAVGDGNHSLATAKTIYESYKQQDPVAAAASPARYALVEMVNIHDPALDFEPIYRVLTDLKPGEAERLVGALRAYAEGLCHPVRTGYPAQSIVCLSGGRTQTVHLPCGAHSLAVGTLDKFLESVSHTGKLDYIHGRESLAALAADECSLGFLFEGMGKGELFAAVMRDGPLPRKTFSMGHAKDKRYYIEARKIRA